MRDMTLLRIKPSLPIAKANVLTRAGESVSKASDLNYRLDSSY